MIFSKYLRVNTALNTNLNNLIRVFIVFFCVCVFWINALIANAANISHDLLKQKPTEITINLGNNADELKFEPSHLEFEAGKRYKLKLVNPSSTKHYFTAKDFTDGIWTQKVEAGGVEVKGAIHEVELKPQAEAEWVFLPLKNGKYNLKCTIAGHAAAGMIGDILIKS
ncbi:MAG: cupredoxin domain-containing protein [Cyanobacteria bacterium P01_A01_bin.84]